MTRSYERLERDTAWRILCGKDCVEDVRYGDICVQNRLVTIQTQVSTTEHERERLVDARNEMKTWRIQPRSIFEFDPLEDGKESISLSALRQTDEKVIYEGYGKRQFQYAIEDDSLGLTEFYDPAHNHKPREYSAHPGFKSPMPRSPIPKRLMVEVEKPRGCSDVMRFTPTPLNQPYADANSEASVVEEIIVPEEAVPLGNPEYQPPEIPKYSNFNRVASPYRKV